MHPRHPSRSIVAAAVAAGLIACAVPATAQAAPSHATGASVATADRATAAQPTELGWGDLGKTAYAVYDKLTKCLGNIKSGLPCLNNDSDNIRAVYTRLAEMDKTIKANHEEVVTQLNRIENLVRGLQLKDLNRTLLRLETHGNKADLAFASLVECQAAATSEPAGVCHPYRGGYAQEPEETATTALPVTMAELRQQTDLMGRDIEEVVAAFAGHESQITDGVKGSDGLAFVLWSGLKRVQEQSIGIPANSPVIDRSRTPFVTPTLASELNGLLDFYNTLFQRYGFYRILAASGDEDAKKRRSQVEGEILGRQDGPGQRRFSVLGTVRHYSLPALVSGQLLFRSDAGRAIVVSGSAITIGGGSAKALTPELVRELAVRANKYAPVERWAHKMPTAFPADRWYSVAQPVHDEYVSIWFDEWRPVTLRHLAGSGQKPNATCHAQVQLLSEKPTWGRAYSPDAKSRPQMPKNFFKIAWKDLIGTAPLVYAWDHTMYVDSSADTVELILGQGSWLQCAPDATPHNVLLLDDEVPMLS